MQEEIIEHLQTVLQEYRGRDYALAYVLHVLRGKITGYLFEQHLDPNTYSIDQQTNLVVAAMCNAGVRVN